VKVLGRKKGFPRGIQKIFEINTGAISYRKANAAVGILSGGKNLAYGLGGEAATVPT